MAGLVFFLILVVFGFIGLGFVMWGWTWTGLAFLAALAIIVVWFINGARI